ncbi:MAG: hypothetical protein L0211_22005, partial [Planctomycetaceae bacterium]|nr:hypothetical protein [Planctomycetaceae bacterium]
LTRLYQDQFPPRRQPLLAAHAVHAPTEEMVRYHAHSDDARSIHVVFDNGDYFAHVAKSGATLDRWSLSSLLLAGDKQYESHRSEELPNFIGFTDILGGVGSERGIVAKLTQAPIEAVNIENVQGPEGRDCRLVDVRFNQSSTWNGRQPPRQLKVVVARDYAWLPIKTVEITSEGIIATAFIDGWHQEDERWVWSRCRGYVGTDEPDPKKLVMEWQLSPGSNPADFDTGRCFLAYYGIPEPQITRWPSFSIPIVVVVALVALFIAWRFHRTRGRTT